MKTFKEMNEFKNWVMTEADNVASAGMASPLSGPAVDEPDNVKDDDEIEKDTDTSGEASPLTILSEDREVLCPYCSSDNVDYLTDFSATSWDESEYECNNCGKTFLEHEVDDAYGDQPMTESVGDGDKICPECGSDNVKHDNESGDYYKDWMVCNSCGENFTRDQATGAYGDYYDKLDEDFDFSRQKPVKCVHCKKQKGDHKAKTHECPKGSKSRIGYTHYGPETFKAKEEKKVTTNEDISYLTKLSGIKIITN